MSNVRFNENTNKVEWVWEGYKMSGVDEKTGWGVPHWPTEYGSTDDDWVYNCQHKWVDTGMRKTFCKHCNVEGDYNPMTGQVSIVMKKKEEDKK